MGFLQAAAVLAGALFSHHGARVSTSSGYPPPSIDLGRPLDQGLLGDMNAQMDQMNEDTLAQGIREDIATGRATQQAVALGQQSNRAEIRASTLASITSRHEGLMQSIQQAESTHIKSSFDLVKQS